MADMDSIGLILWLGFGLAFAESGLGLGMIVPGETVVVFLAAMLDSPLESAALFAVVATGASAGDHLGFLIGRRYGGRLRETVLIRKLGASHWDRAMDALRRNGAAAIFFTRLVPVVRTLTPAAGGASGLSYRRFAPASFAGSMLWAGVYVGGGSAAAVALDVMSSTLGRATWLMVVAVAVIVLPVLMVRRLIGVLPVRPAPEMAHFEKPLRAHQADLVAARTGMR